MNFEIKIFPSQLIPCSFTWNDLRLKLIAFDGKLHFNLIDSNKDYSRLIVQGLEELALTHPSGILKTVEEASNFKENPDADREVSLRFSYQRLIEFASLDKTIYWNLDYGIKGLYEINEDSLEEIPGKLLSKELYENYKESLIKHKYLISLETDLSSDYLDPIWFLALMLCKLIGGVALVEHSFTNYSLSSGYYQVGELESICTKHEF